MPDSVHGFQEKILKSVQVVPLWLDSGSRKTRRGDECISLTPLATSKDKTLKSKLHVSKKQLDSKKLNSKP